MMLSGLPMSHRYSVSENFAMLSHRPNLRAHISTGTICQTTVGKLVCTQQNDQETRHWYRRR